MIEFDMEHRKCRMCAYSVNLLDAGWVCQKRLMIIHPDMLVIFKIETGTCFRIAKPRMNRRNEL